MGFVDSKEGVLLVKFFGGDLKIVADQLDVKRIKADHRAVTALSTFGAFKLEFVMCFLRFER